jgi:hypothetical protein
MAGYGSEFVNFFVDVLREDENAARPIGGILVGELGGQVARTIYFPPRNQIRPQGRRQPAGYVISPPPSSVAVVALARDPKTIHSCEADYSVCCA